MPFFQRVSREREGVRSRLFALDEAGKSVRHPVRFGELQRFLHEQTSCVLPGELIFQLALGELDWERVSDIEKSQLLYLGRRKEVKKRPTAFDEAIATVHINDGANSYNGNSHGGVRIAALHESLRRIVVAGYSLESGIRECAVSVSKDEFPPVPNDGSVAYHKFCEVLEPMIPNMKGVGAFADLLTPAMIEETRANGSLHDRSLMVRYEGGRVRFLDDGMHTREKGFFVDEDEKSLVVGYRPPHYVVASVTPWRIALPKALERRKEIVVR